MAVGQASFPYCPGGCHPLCAKGGSPHSPLWSGTWCEASLFSSIFIELLSCSLADTLQWKVGKGNGDVEGVKYMGHQDSGGPS